VGIAKPAAEGTPGGNAYRLRLRLGLSQKDIAERTGLTQQAVSKFETGLSLPRWPTLEKYAAVYGVTVEQMLGGE
jgi:transcriptional regulator with XRE-family HTH domain